MFPNQMTIGLSFDAFSVEVNVPLEGFRSWFGDVQELNEQSRARDRGEPVPSLVYRNVCPCCGSGTTALTAVEGIEGRLRLCLTCRAEFTPGADE